MFAALADKMMMVRQKWLGQLIVRLPANANSGDDTQSLKGVDDAVDAGTVDVRTPLRDITCGQRDISVLQRAKDGLPRRCEAKPRLP